MELVRFFEGLQTNGERLAQALLVNEQLHGRGSRELFAEALDLIKLAQAAVQAAQGFYIHNRLSYLAIRDFASLSRYAPTGVAKSGLTRRLIHQLLPFAQLLQGVRIARRGYRSALCQAAASENAFVFLDPPYESVDQKKSYKGHAEAIYNTTFDFDLFARCVHAVKRKVKFMITINDGDANRKRFGEFFMLRRRVFYGASKTTKGELVIMNYAPPHAEYFARKLGWQVL